MTKECNKCKKEYTKLSTCSKKEWAGRKYCSQSCANSVNLNGKLIDKGTTAWNKGMKFPERSGENNPRNTKITLECLQCKKVFQRKKHEERTAKFCSKKCHYKHNDKGLTSANERIRQSAAYKEWRERVFKRDDYTCQMCGERGGTLNADHVMPFALYTELRLDVLNGQTLCEECHRQTPSFGGVNLHAQFEPLIAVAEEA